MPCLRNIFSRRAESEGSRRTELPISPGFSKSLGSSRSPISPRFSLSPRAPRSPNPLTQTEQNTDYLNQCAGCSNVEDLIRQNLAHRKEGLVRVPMALLHSSFEELNHCAVKCQICRVFRQALLVEEITFNGVEQLKNARGRVNVRWMEPIGTSESLTFHLRVEVENRPNLAGKIHCNRKNEAGHLALRPDPRDTIVIAQATEWLDNCLKDHIGVCDNLRFSRETPQLLVEILSPDTVRLVEIPEVEYVALSYCWGKETDEVRLGKTVEENLERRHNNFSTKELPATVRDVLYIIHAMGLRYAWIDSLCINQDTSEGVETMHKVYSNALFTICACSTDNATSKMLDQREAWTLRTEPCRLGGQWLTTPDMPLDELRLRSPMAARAWTLQEERLSPRMLYISSSRMYWSCARSQEIELKPAYDQRDTKMQRPLYIEVGNVHMPQAQEFLMTCFARDRDLYELWADIVRSYALRNMSHLKDRLNAVSGLAARYASVNMSDDYLAGLWANNLPEGLSWKVGKAVEAEPAIRGESAIEWPSWSWAVLPLQTPIETQAKLARSTYFRRFSEEKTAELKPIMDAENNVHRGVDVKELCVSGRLRCLWKSSSRWVDWSKISKTAEGEERFTFAAQPDQNVHAVETVTGRIIVYEDRQKEVIGQLDFQRDISRLRGENEQLMALEIGKTVMLLLLSCSEQVYQRVGVAWDVRENFFSFIKQTVITLT